MLTIMTQELSPRTAAEFQFEARPAARTKTRRRQFRSCDQCRKGKRACDIVIPSQDDQPCSGSCSNCAKTGKLCTIEWLKSRDGRRSSTTEQPSTAESKDESYGVDWDGPGATNAESKESLLDLPPPPNVQGHQQDFDLRQISQLTSTPFSNVTSDCSADLLQQSSMQNELPRHSGGDHWLPLNSTNSMLDVPAPNYCSIYPMNDPLPFVDIDTNECFEGLFQEPKSTNNAIRFWDDSSNHHVANSHNPDAIDVAFGSIVNQTSNSTRIEVPNQNIGRYRRRSSVPTPITHQMRNRVSKTRRSFPSFGSQKYMGVSDPSSANLEYRLASSTNKTLISESLLKIYHDSMENALSCWLTEKTCPYDVELRSTVLLRDRGNGVDLGSSWTNRIFQRVCRLDRGASGLRGRALARAEETAVEMALRKTIMAFATQWAYSSRRSATNFSSVNNNASRENEEGEAEFDRSMQELLWHEANASLQDTAHIASFRLVFANIIFALTQRPRNVTQSLQDMKLESTDTFEMPNNYTQNSNRDQRLGSETSLLSHILELEGPPDHLEKALRQMYTYRCKLERLEAQSRTTAQKSQYGLSELSSLPKTFGPLDLADRKTFNMLFWLAIMFDTLSAAINKRPLVVSDEDSDILRTECLPSRKAPERINLDFQSFESTSIPDIQIKAPNSAMGSMGKNDSPELWGEFFFDEDASTQGRSVARWPCSNETAAATLCDAAPVKVVLFRRVTRLQSLLSRRSLPIKVEQAIDEAIAVHEYWNNIYGPFFHDCMSHHETLPARIQSWYTVLAGHWHLAGLLLADIIFEVDESELGDGDRRLNRISTRLVDSLRVHNAFAVSDLGRCSCPHAHSSLSRSKEFHAAVNNGALLTEPWTEVLIQSFSKACSVLLDMVPVSRRDGGFEVESTIQRCEDCIKGLWYLGRKSDIALLAANVLSDSLREKLDGIETHWDSRVPAYEQFENQLGAEKLEAWEYTDADAPAF